MHIEQVGEDLFIIMMKLCDKDPIDRTISIYFIHFFGIGRSN